MLNQESEQILGLLDSGSQKLQEIADTLKVSLDKVKRVSRVRNMRIASKDHLTEIEYTTLIQLGFKILIFSDLVREEDWDNLSEVLQNASKNTTRKDLILLVKASKEKKKRIQTFKENMKMKIEKLEKKEQDLVSIEKEIERIEKIILQETTYLKKYTEDEKNFLLEHLGVFEESLTLSRRLDSRWQALLKKKGVLQYDEEKFVWRVLDLDAFAKDYSRRTERNYATLWEYERELKRNPLYRVPTSPDYKRSTGLAVSLQTELKEIQQRKVDVNKKKLEIKRALATLKKESPQSFFESVQATDLLSSYDLKEHAKLQEKSLKMLYREGYIVSTEVTLPNNQRADLIGYNREGKIIIIEVKANREDFLQDKKWQGYLPYCHEIYFLLGKNIYGYFDTEKYSPAGLLIEKGRALIIEKNAKKHDRTLTDLSEVIFSINQNLCRKLIYGY